MSRKMLISTFNGDNQFFMNPERRIYNNALSIELIKRLKILSVETNRRQNDLIEEAIRDLLKKYESQEQSKEK